MPTPVAAERRRSAEAMLEAFLEEIRRRHYSTAFLDQARHVLPRFLSHLRDDRLRDLRGVTEAHVEASMPATWPDARRGTGGQRLSPRSSCTFS